MKRIFAFALTVLMLCSLGASAFAEVRTESWDDMGFKLTYTEEFDNTKGICMPFPYPSVQDGIYSMIINYYAISKEMSDALNEKAKNGELTEEDTLMVMNAMCNLLVVVGIDGNRSAAEMVEALDNDDVEEAYFTQVGKHDDITYYALTAPEYYKADIEKLPADYAEEYLALQSAMVEVMKNAEYFTPHSAGEDVMGMHLEFETTDVDGNVVKSEELFAAHEITVLNIWATWCGPCKSELPELGEIARGFEEKGKDAALVGICQDADEMLDECKNILAESNVDYLNLLPYDGLIESLDLSVFPTTLFVGRDGSVLMPPIQGVLADLSNYDLLVDAFLASAASEEDAAPEPAAADEGPVKANNDQVYRIIVTDSNGDPVQGATIQFCDDAVCMMGKTDAEGDAVFEVEEKTYTVHVLKVPEGYEKNPEEFTTLDTFCDVGIVLQKAA